MNKIVHNFVDNVLILGIANNFVDNYVGKMSTKLIADKTVHNYVRNVFTAQLVNNIVDNSVDRLFTSFFVNNFVYNYVDRLFKTHKAPIIADKIVHNFVDNVLIRWPLFANYRGQFQQLPFRCPCRAVLNGLVDF